MGQDCGKGLIDTGEFVKVLKLRALHGPVGASDGAALSGIQEGEEVELSDIVAGPEVEVLSWRYSEKQGGRNSVASTKRPEKMSKDAEDLPPWPEQRCFVVHHRFWRVSLIDKPGCFGILQMASNPGERTVENLEVDIEASASTAAYAHKFNTQQAAEQKHDPPPAIRVAAPIGCQIVDSDFSSMFSVGDAVVLYVLPRVQAIHKYVFSASDEYLDLPQAFFHFVAVISGGRELAYDLQGVQDESGDLLIVNPAIMKAQGKSSKQEVPVCGPLLAAGSSELEFGHFQALHQRCSPLCKVFDPHRTVRLGRGFTCCGN